MPAITRGINVIARCGNQFRGELLKGLSLTAFQAPYILHVCARPGLSQEDLARELHVNPSNAARQLAALEELGFVTRVTRPEDKRQLAVFPTQKAIDAAPAVREANERWNEYLTRGMTAAETGALEALLERMRARAEAWDAGRGGQA
ncbi:MAG TPA: MarR family transcriptional regulator [Candidatus Limnocylindria bacterium]|nr:MarR family transcriptional regulator [Candidatus Limnocylindria bacterium]